ncbi:DUF5681 domain-containing protein [Azospirillum argentinense]|uniref:DUF5681 domain-containing protein n=1 Tax=Azospirillum argentinense TaxID=2970906 RepID=UPI0010C15141|nr:DUF5681 domain-containing protein [Azospirillum argentinense]
MTGDDEVGYKKPPASHRFQPGKSGNPKGRPKKSRNLHTTLMDILKETVTLREGDRVRTVSKGEAMLLAQMQKAMKGDTRAFTALAKMTSQVASQSQPPPANSAVLVVPGMLAEEEWIALTDKQQAYARGNTGSDEQP